MTTFEVRAPGKLFVIGEYAVLHGSRALVAAIDAGISCRIESASTWCLSAPDLGVDGTLAELPGDSRSALLRAAVMAARDEFQLASPLRFVVLGTCPASRRKYGLGGSAASVVAILAAAAATVGEDLEAKRTRDRLFRRAFAVHREHQRGRGSGADVAASVFGGWVDYAAAEGGPRIAAAVPPPGIRLAAAWSGVARDTARAIEVSDGTRALSRLRAILDRFWVAVAAQDRVGFLSAIDAYGSALDELAGRSPGAQRINELVGAAHACGVAAKGSGAVGGDCAIAIAFDPARLPAAEERWRTLEAEPLAVSIDTRGVRHEDTHA
jgi:mevalonate kinase